MMKLRENDMFDEYFDLVSRMKKKTGAFGKFLNPLAKKKKWPDKKSEEKQKFEYN